MKKKIAIVSVLAIVVSAAVFSYAQAVAPDGETYQNKAVNEAIAMLTKRLEDGQKQNADCRKIKSAIIRLQQVVAAKPCVLLNDFADNTATYKGKTVTLRAHATVLAFNGETLSSYAGKKLAFQAYDTSDNSSIDTLFISIPKNINIPSAGSTDDLFITFKCTKGTTKDGNEALSIVRAYPSDDKESP